MMNDDKPLPTNLVEAAMADAQATATKICPFNGGARYDRILINAYLSHPAVREIFEIEADAAHKNYRHFNWECVLKSIGAGK